MAVLDAAKPYPLKGVYKLSDYPDVPDLVRCTDPDNPERFVIGRIVAKNGEPIAIIGDVANSRNRRQPSGGRCKDQLTADVVARKVELVVD